MFKNLERPTVSRYGELNLIPSLLAAARTNPTSKSALCATSSACPQKARNSGRTSPIFLASLTSSLVIDVSSVISADITESGFTNVEYLSTISPLETLTAPISIISPILQESINSIPVLLTVSLFISIRTTD